MLFLPNKLLSGAPYFLYSDKFIKLKLHMAKEGVLYTPFKIYNKRIVIENFK